MSINRKLLLLLFVFAVAGGVLFAALNIKEAELLVIHAQQGAFTQNPPSLTLIDVGTTLSFTKGSKSGGTFPIDAYVEQWQGIKEANLIFTSPAKEGFTTLPLSLSTPTYDAKRGLLTFRIEHLNGKIPPHVMHEPVLYLTQN